MSVPVLVEVRRGRAVESVHGGAVVAVDAAGEIVAACGPADLRSFTRSALKPLQALPLVADGGLARFSFASPELAVICGSHAGEEMHVAAVRAILRKIDLDEGALQCAGHWPFHQPTADAMRARGEEPGPVHDNCSGKHAGMLALARLHGWDHHTYRRIDHPVQQRIREAIIALASSPDVVATPAIDGCGVPTYQMTLRDLAVAFARLVSPDDLAPPWPAAARAVVAAMTGFPGMVAGTDRLDTVLIAAADGRLLVKGGAEAIAAVGARQRRLGLVLKIADGGARAVGPALIEALSQLGLLRAADLHVLAPFHRPPLRDRQGNQVGEIVPVFRLE